MDEGDGVLEAQDDWDDVLVKTVKGYQEQLVAFHERYRGWLESLQAQPCDYIETIEAVDELRKESLALGWTISRGTTMMMGLLGGLIELPELEDGEPS